ncbi:hypothetical protein SNEBB_011449 [Seison nebaliae]|nr:hypothetical protein SNEBB_011449 [Seison nebaliae]
MEGQESNTSVRFVNRPRTKLFRKAETVVETFKKKNTKKNVAVSLKQLPGIIKRTKMRKSINDQELLRSRSRLSTATNTRRNQGENKY